MFFILIKAALTFEWESLKNCVFMNVYFLQRTWRPDVFFRNALSITMRENPLQKEMAMFVNATGGVYLVLA